MRLARMNPQEWRGIFPMNELKVLRPHIGLSQEQGRHGTRTWFARADSAGRNAAERATGIRQHLCVHPSCCRGIRGHDSRPGGRSAHLRTQAAFVVSGCLPGRYGADVEKELPEVDLWLPLEEEFNWAEKIDAALQRNTHEQARLLSTGPSYAYLKIGEGCSHRCDFCTIPFIRGDARSTPPDQLVAEAGACSRPEQRNSFWLRRIRLFTERPGAGKRIGAACGQTGRS